MVRIETRLYLGDPHIVLWSCYLAALMTHGFRRYLAAETRLARHGGSIRAVALGYRYAIRLAEFIFAWGVEMPRAFPGWLGNGQLIGSDDFMASGILRRDGERSEGAQWVDFLRGDVVFFLHKSS